ncbi:MAG: fused MFS/spermidine synthase, partial [Bryobacteraceae bacterium]
AAVPSLLLLAVTNHLCQNVAAIPFLWVLPLALYLLTFILCFDRPIWHDRRVSYWLLPGGLGLIHLGLLKVPATASLPILIPVFGAGFFLCCMFCHGELARRKPDPRHLTAFYLMISLGGALGALFAGFGAPTMFRGYFELPLAASACGIVALFLIYGKHWLTDIVWVSIGVGLVVAATVEIRAFVLTSRVMMRNFYGGVRTVDQERRELKPPGSVRMMVHGVTNHGAQILDEGRRRAPTAYYGAGSGVEIALRHVRRSTMRAGFVGLGAGTLAVYGRKGDVFRFYEINPQVKFLADTEFTFLRDSDAAIEVVLGDARLSLEREAPNGYDLLVVDAFSGDSVPVHLLTREAFAVYFRHLKPDGVLALHVSNDYLDLAPVVRRLADESGKTSRYVVTEDDPSREIGTSMWMLVAGSEDFFARAGLPEEAGAPRTSLWT